MRSENIKGTVGKICQLRVLMMCFKYSQDARELSPLWFCFCGTLLPVVQASLRHLSEYLCGTYIRRGPVFYTLPCRPSDK